MKRVWHYLILATVLLGTPLACCLLGGYDEILEGVKQFPPRTEDWGFHPEKLWNVRRPFNWWWFSGFTLFTAACLFPFLRRGFRRLRRPSDPTIEQSEQSNNPNNRTIRTIEQSNNPNNRTIRTIRTIEQSNNRTIRTIEQSNNRTIRIIEQSNTFPLWGWAGLALLIISWVVAWSRFPCFTRYQQAILSYFPVWTGYIVFINAVVKWRKGTCPLTEHPWLYVATFPASSLFWWFFEYLNRYVWNWYYLGIENFTPFQYTFYASICFASVLPAVYATAEFLGTFRFFDDRNYDGMAWRPNVRSPVSCCVLAALSAVGLCGIVFCPDYVYLFLWVSPLMVFVLVQILLREPCILDRLASGAWGLVFRWEIAALCCGLCWETWNYYALAKWVYAVPWVHAFQIWEMPLIGFAGYLPFGVECAAVTYWIYSGASESRS